MTVTASQVNVDAREVTVASTSHEEGTSNLVKESVDQDHSNRPESVGGHESDVDLGESNIYD